MTSSEVPYNVEAEAAVLGALLIDPSAYAQIEGIVESPHFYLQKHKWIFDAMRKLHNNGEPLDFLTLITELDKSGKLEPAGGGAYVSQLINCVPSSIGIASYARIVYDAWRRREMVDLAGDVARIAYKQDEDITQAADYLQARIAELFAAQDRRNWQPFSEIAPLIPEVKWLWPSWIPLSMISLLGATSGAGKSMVALELCKRVIHGIPFPGTQASNPTGNVIYVDAEYVPETIKERATWWKMDLSKFFLMQARPNDMVDFTRPEYREQLRAMVSSIKPRMVVIDSLSSVTSKGENAIEEVRSIMGFLNEVANAHKTAMVVIHHIRKKGAQAFVSTEVTKDDFRGSSHITAMARSVIGLSVVQTGPDVDPNGPRKLAVLKANLCGYPEPIGCEFLPMYPAGIMVQWDAKAPEPYKPPTKLEECAAFLQNLLRDTGEPLSPKEIIGMAREEGFSRDLVFQARKSLGKHIQNTGGYKDPANQWELVE